MSRVVRMHMEGSTLVIQTRVYLDCRLPDPALAKNLLLDGLQRISLQGPYPVGEESIRVRVETEFAPKFSFSAVNVRMEDRKAVRRHGIMRLFNTISRAYLGARRRGLLKLCRFLLRFPDLFINIAGRDLTQPMQYEVQASIVAHEFGHIWGCRDQYRYRDNSKRRPDVANGDIMYRTGGTQRMQPYHIAGFCRCARRGRLPLRPI